MSEQTETAVEPVEEQKSGGSVAGAVGTVLGAGAAGHFTKEALEKRGIKRVLQEKTTPKPPVVEVPAEKPVEVLSGDTNVKAPETPKAPEQEKSKVTEKFRERVKRAYKDEKVGEALSKQSEILTTVKKIDPKDVTEILFEAKDNKFSAILKTSSADVLIENIEKLPEGAKTGEILKITTENAEKLVTGEKSFLKASIATYEKSLAKGIKKVDGYFKGIKSLSLGEGALLAGAVVAGGVVGNKVLHAIAGGKHTNDVKARVEAPEQAAAR